jgi:5-methylcytosine-specific restriction endonuclease McrA
LGCGNSIDHMAITALTCDINCRYWAKRHPGVLKPEGKVCAQCGVDISRRGSRAIYCSIPCRDKSPDYLANARANAKRRRATLDGNVCIPFTDDQLAQRMSMYGSRCYICTSNHRVTVDHVKPVLHGGPHMLANLRPMCKSCNAIKNAVWPMPPELLSRVGEPLDRKEALRSARRSYGQARRAAEAALGEAG